MGDDSMVRSGRGPSGLLLCTLSLFGCDTVAGGDPAQGLEQGVNSGDGGLVLISRDAGLGTLITKPVEKDSGGLTTELPPKDAGRDAAQGDAGHDAGPIVEDAGVVPPQDAGQVNVTPDCKTTFYRDLDEDGFGDPAAKVLSCTQPPGYVLVAGDCYDGNERARPGSVGQFLTHRGDGSFDYDCDGIETQVRTKFAVCPKLAGACPPESIGCHDGEIRIGWDAAEDGGWTDFRIVPCLLGDRCPTDKSKVPACGQAGYWGLSVAWDLLGAKFACTIPVAGTTRIQTCR